MYGVSKRFVKIQSDVSKKLSTKVKPRSTNYRGISENSSTADLLELVLQVQEAGKSFFAQ